MAVWADVIGQVVSRVTGVLRGWVFQVGFAEPPTAPEIAQAIEEVVQGMALSTSPRLAKWVAENAPIMQFEIMGIYRDD